MTDYLRLFQVISGYDMIGHVRSGYFRLSQDNLVYVWLGQVWLG